MAIERGGAQRGDTVILRIRFEQSGVLFDPSSIDSVEILDTSLAVVATLNIADIVHDGVGQYHINWAIPSAEPLELHHDRWVVTSVLGGSQKTFTLSFYVFDFSVSASGSPYMTTAELAAYLPDGTGLSGAQIAELGMLGQEIVETLTGQRFLPTTEARVVDGLGKSVQPLPWVIVRDSLGLLEILYETTWQDVTPTNLAHIRYSRSRRMISLGNSLSKGQMYGAPAYHEPYWLRPTGSCGLFPMGYQNIRITAQWGRFQLVPRQIKAAVGLLVKYAGSCDDPAGVPSNPFVSEGVPGGRDYTLREIKRNADTDRGTGYPDVDAILQRFKRGAHTAIVL